MVTFHLDSQAYWTLRNDATTLSHEASTAMRSGEIVEGLPGRRISCARGAADELRQWFKDNRQRYLAMSGPGHKSLACERALEAIDAALRSAPALESGSPRPR